MNWYEYQEEVAVFFRNLGANVETNKRISGIRGTHDIDVYIEINVLGQKTIWIAECKLWKTAIPKDKILTLYQIVQDIGADKGLLFSESGFQSGAINSTKQTNILLISIDEMKEMVKDELNESFIINSIKKFNELKSRIKKLWINEDYQPEPFNGAPFDDIILLDGTVMFFTLNLQKYLNPSFPITISTYKNSIQRLNSYEELTRVVQREIQDIEKDVIKVEKIYHNYCYGVEIMKNKFLASIDKFLKEGERFILNKEKSEIFGKEIVNLMRNISDLASEIKSESRANLNKLIDKIMRYLIDNHYLHLTQIEDNNISWINSTQELSKIIDEFKQKKDY
ncbi:restriction endonuclease [Chryseobacterium sp. M5A1_1a]